MADIVRLTPVCAFADNYIWVLHDTRHAVAIDPGEAAPLLDFLAREQLTLHAIWVTHLHHDHIGGIEALCQRWPQARVYGPNGTPCLSDPVMDGSLADGLPGLPAEVWEVPGHTANHVAYHAGQYLFCGDTLFGAGCGRVFDGSIEQLHASLQRIARLPDDTLLCPAHEYTLSNLQFALTVEPGNADLHARWQADQARREQGVPTVPTLLAAERATNPFLRCHLPAVVQAAQQHAAGTTTESVAIFATLRAWKNDFRAA